MSDDKPMSQKSAHTYFEALIAAVLANAMIVTGVSPSTDENSIAVYKRILQKLRSEQGGTFN